MSAFRTVPLAAPFRRPPMKRLALWLASSARCCSEPLRHGHKPERRRQAAIRIGFQTGEVNVLLSYAVQSGLFEKEGLAVTLAQFPAGPAMLPALAAGEVDLAWMGEFPAVTGYANACRSRSCSWSASTPRTCGWWPTGRRHREPPRPQGQAHRRRDRLDQPLSPAARPRAGRPEGGRRAPREPRPGQHAAGLRRGPDRRRLRLEPNVGAMERMGAKPIASTKSLGMITGGVWVARKAFVTARARPCSASSRRGPGAEGLCRRSRRRPSGGGQADRHGRPGLRRAGGRQSVAHPSFRQTLTADFLGAPGQEMDSG